MTKNLFNMIAAVGLFSVPVVAQAGTVSKEELRKEIQEEVARQRAEARAHRKQIEKTNESKVHEAAHVVRPEKRGRED